NDETTPSRFGPRHCGQSAVLWLMTEVPVPATRSRPTIATGVTRMGDSGKLFLFDRDDVLEAADEERPLGNRGRRQHDLADVIGGEELVRRTGFDDVDVAVLAREIQLAVGRHGRRAERSAGADALLVHALPVA